MLSGAFCVNAHGKSPLENGTKQYRVNNEALAKIKNMEAEFMDYQHLVQNTTAESESYPREDYETAKVRLAQLDLAHEIRYSELGQDNLDEALAANPSFFVELTEKHKKHKKLNKKSLQENIQQKRQLVEPPTFDAETAQQDVGMGKTLLETDLELANENFSSQMKPHISIL